MVVINSAASLSNLISLSISFCLIRTKKKIRKKEQNIVLKIYILLHLLI